MKIAGLQKLTLIDYPGRPACTIFLAGCNLSCPWCHSPDLVLKEKIKKVPQIEKEDLFEFLRKRRSVLEGVVICGGEPTVHGELPKFIKEISSLGYKVKLDTNGTNPEMIKRIVEDDLVDYIAMDLKAPLNKYKELVGTSPDPEKIRRSIAMIKKMDDYEFRTTLIPNVHNKESLILILEEIEGVKNFYLQNFRGKRTLSSEFEGKSGFTKKEMKKFKEVAQKYVQNCQIR